MNTIQISNAVIVKYSKENPVGFVKKENNVGEYIAFRCLERNYNEISIPWMCFANGEMINRIERLKLKPGDQIIVSGTVKVHVDKEKKKESYHLIISAIDYIYCGMKEKKPAENELKSNDEVEKQVDNLDLDQCDIFQSKIE